MKLGFSSQQRAMTLLKNEDGVLPLHSQPKIYIKNIDPAITAQYAQVVDTPERAEYSILRLETPWVPVETRNPFAQGFHHGDLDFKDEAKAEILSIIQAVPTIVVLNLDRPAVIPEIAAEAKALFGEFGASDKAVLDVIFGKAKPEGKLPFELPSSMDAVRHQNPDVPYDSKNPLFAFGYGLRYENS
jgi:beta-glucosidase